MARDWKPREIELPLRDGVSMRFCRVRPGEFWMGSRRGIDEEEPEHRVRITGGFWLGKYPVTQRQYAVLRPEHRGAFHNNDNGNHPVTDVSWDDAVEYCNDLSREFLGGIARNRRSMLPSEAQWECACRGRTESRTDYCNGDGELLAVGWIQAHADVQTHAVGQLEANSLGLHDLHGNVWEWCRDVWEEHAYATRVDGARDPERVATASDLGALRRVLRGGSFLSTPWRSRSACRQWSHPAERNYEFGFRVGLFSGPPRQEQGVAPGGRAVDLANARIHGR